MQQCAEAHLCGYLVLNCFLRREAGARGGVERLLDADCKLNRMNGLLVLDKAAGMTSHDVVAIVRRATGERSIGHLGTLDPMATGVLPLLLGKYTRLAQFFGKAEKQYTGTIRFGFATDSFDADGAQVGEAVPLSLGLEELRGLAARFAGEMDQVPPIYSAKKIGGVAAHKLARAGVDVPVKAARIFIHAFELLGLDEAKGEASFRMHVSAGGYVRSVAHELGQMAGCGAHLSSLRRTQAGPFTLAESITVAELKAMAGTDAIEARLPHPRTILPEMPSVTVDEQTAGKLRNGMQVNLPEYSDAGLVKVFTSPTEMLAVAKRVAGTLMQPIVVLG
jgi:tRNA pseudouridine55 synthase